MNTAVVIDDSLATFGIGENVVATIYVRTGNAGNTARRFFEKRPDISKIMNSSFSANSPASITSEGYKREMVELLQKRKKAPGVLAPKDKDDFSAWLNKE